jgi:putative FmdB family regulatory protein
LPIYTYRCEKCGIQFDEQKSFNDPPLTRCPECSSNALRKIFQPVGIVFKGSGFYATDNRSPSGAGRVNEKKESDITSDSRSEKKKETKTESKEKSPSKPDTKTEKKE